MSMLNEYQDRFNCVRLERNDGVLVVVLHTEGESLLWGKDPHDELGAIFTAIAGDPENKIVILTGTGEEFIRMAPPSSRSAPLPGSLWREVATSGERLIRSHLSIPVPIIAAVNGPALIHSELAVLCDIVLASETAIFADVAHVPRGLVPGDGVNVIYSAIMGVNRARYFLLTGQSLNAQQALDAGIVAEVLPAAELMNRARELAAQLSNLPPATLRYTRAVLTASLGHAVDHYLPPSLAMEGLAAAEYWPGIEGPFFEAPA